MYDSYRDEVYLSQCEELQAEEEEERRREEQEQDPPKCERCDGTGLVVHLIRSSHCHHGLGCPQCVQDRVQVCPDCSGTGKATCAVCGDNLATGWDEGDPVCETCAPQRRAA